MGFSLGGFSPLSFIDNTASGTGGIQIGGTTTGQLYENLNFSNNVVNALQNPLSFSTGGLLGGSGGIATFNNIGGAGVQNSSLQGGLSNQNNSYGLAALATYFGGSAIGWGNIGSYLGNVNWTDALGTAGTLGNAYSNYQNAQEQQQLAQQQLAAQQQQFALQQRQAEIANLRSIRQSVRQQRMQAGQIANQAAITGTSQSTGALGAAASNTAGLSGELNYFGETASLQNRSNQVTLGLAEQTAASSSRMARNTMVGAFGQLGTQWAWGH